MSIVEHRFSFSLGRKNPNEEIVRCTCGLNFRSDDEDWVTAEVQRHLSEELLAAVVALLRRGM